MSTELINRITVKKDGVYASSHSSNDTSPYHSWRCRGLSEIYDAERQKGLDREGVPMLYEYAELRGSHKSLARYRYAKEAPRPCCLSEIYGQNRRPLRADPDAAAVTMVWGYIGEPVFNMLVLVGAVKIADRVVREMMGL